MADVYHALGLNMHQPPGNLIALHNSDERWEARQILWCYDRPTRMLEGYEDVARLHMSLSGTLLKQLEDPGVRETFRDVVDIEDFLERYRRSPIEFLGSGLYHPVYPLICPPTDEVEVYRGAWNTGHHWGGDFAQWAGSLLQKKGLDEVRGAAAYYTAVKRRFEERSQGASNPDEVRHLITSAYDHILLAETSCNFFWGSHWVHRTFDELELSYRLLDQAMSQLRS